MKIIITDTPIDLYAASGIAPGTLVDVQASPKSIGAGILAGGDGTEDKEAYNHLESSDWRNFQDNTLFCYSFGSESYVIVNDSTPI